MPSTTNFQAWLDANPPVDFEQLYDLYRSVADRTSYGDYKVLVREGLTFLTHGKYQLMVVSEPARKLLLQYIADLRDDQSEVDMDVWYYFKRGLAED